MTGDLPDLSTRNRIKTRARCSCGAYIWSHKAAADELTACLPEARRQAETVPQSDRSAFVLGMVTPTIRRAAANVAGKCVACHEEGL